MSSQRRRHRQRQPTGPRERVTLELTGVAHGGEAIGRHEGRVFFVPYGLPGETVVAEIIQDKPDYARAEIVEIVEASPDRVLAPCAYFGSCGGCQWQHASYEAQLRASSAGSWPSSFGGSATSRTRTQLVLPTIGMAEPWHYRNHARFTVGRRFGELCFTRSGTRQLLRIDHCWLMQPTIDAILARLQRRLPGFSSAPALDQGRRQHRRPARQPGAAAARRIRVPVSEEELERIRRSVRPAGAAARSRDGPGAAVPTRRGALAGRRDPIGPDRAV